MSQSSTVYARIDNSGAANANLNAKPGAAEALIFETGTLGGTLGDNEAGNLHISDTPGIIDTDTTVWVGGVEYEFSFEVAGVLPDDAKMSALNNPPSATGIVGEPVTIITVHDGTSGGTRYFFLQDPTLSGDLTIMTDFPKGARSLDILNAPPPPPVCFTKGTLIRCESGEVAIESLNVGDMVMSADGSLQKIKWIGQRDLSAGDLAENPSFAPVKIAKGAFGKDMPHSDLSVSQQHRMVLDDWRLELLVDGNEALVASKHLVNDQSIRVDRKAEGVTYFHVMFDTHQIIFANGVQSESFHPGEWALGTLTDEVRTELLALFPELANTTDAYGPTARPTLKRAEALALNAA